MERVVPWSRLIAVIEPLYPTSGRVGRQPIGVPRMLRMYCLQQWYGPADEALEATTRGLQTAEKEQFFKSIERVKWFPCGMET